MAIKKVIGKKPKMSTGGTPDPWSGRTVTKSESGNYKTISKDDKSKVRRTIKGAVTGATSVKDAEANRANYAKSQKRNNLAAAKRLENKYLTQTGGKNMQAGKDIYNKIANQTITIPKTKEYGDYKKGGIVKKKKK